jgi:hypothetical protein
LPSSLDTDVQIEVIEDDEDDTVDSTDAASSEVAPPGAPAGVFESNLEPKEEMPQAPPEPALRLEVVETAAPAPPRRTAARSVWKRCQVSPNVAPRAAGV